METLYAKEQIAEMVERLADEISRDCEGRELVMVVLLNGAVFFAVDLMRAVQRRGKVRRLVWDSMRVSSYGDKQTSSGEVRIEVDVQGPIAGKHVLVIDDVADSRLTLLKVGQHLQDRGPLSLKICVAGDKTSQCRQPSVKLDYVGFEGLEGFLVGYGLDDRGAHRGLEEICRI